jgi:hypothetical protein
MDTTKDEDQQQAHSLEEIKPLLELCKAGRLFEIQDWIPNPHQARDAAVVVRDGIISIVL